MTWSQKSSIKLFQFKRCRQLLIKQYAMKLTIKFAAKKLWSLVGQSILLQKTRFVSLFEI